MNPPRFCHARFRRRSETGFTLIELLVVIAVLAILAAIVAFNVTGVTNRGSSAACKTDLESAQSAADAYHFANGSYAPDLDSLVPTYLHSAPTDLGTVNMNSDGAGTVTSSLCS
ncbi:MAG TPA: prepilin-type N-terminal cleavage/methylation domain-containing protein [Candidatus Dormibacteraeota bacterium]|nr:prepilin-type N-terminal cleavage/methylation domain-containing protein [Candidatus Dormibacteraeota bacterium]